MGKLLGGSKSSSKPKDMTPPEYKNLRSPIASALTDLTGLGGDFDVGGPAYGGTSNPFLYAVPMTDLEKTGVTQVGNIAFGSGFDNAFKTASGALTDTASGKYLTPDSNPFLSGAIEAAIRPVRDWYEQTAIPGLKDTFSMAGQESNPDASSPFLSAILKAKTAAGKQIGDIASTLASQHYGTERQNQINAATQLPQISGAQIDQTVSALQSTALPRLIQQYGSDVGLEEFRRRVQLIMQALTTAAGLSSPQGQIGNETKSSSSGGIGPILQGIGQMK